MDKWCKSFKQKTTLLRAKGQEIGQVFLAITQIEYDFDSGSGAMTWHLRTYFLQVEHPSYRNSLKNTKTKINKKYRLKTYPKDQCPQFEWSPSMVKVLKFSLSQCILLLVLAKCLLLNCSLGGKVHCIWTCKIFLNQWLSALLDTTGGNCGFILTRQSWNNYIKSRKQGTHSQYGLNS